MNGLTFDRLRAANDERAKLWNTSGTPLSLEFAGIELCGEAGEVANAIKKHVRFERGLKGGVDASANIAEELADVVICADLVARKMGINLGFAVENKFNATSEKHGFAVRLP